MNNEKDLVRKEMEDAIDALSKTVDSKDAGRLVFTAQY